ncbi:putative 1-O-acylceramide synthase precursor, partial [Planoprotostelium fungivorum]
SFAYHRECMYYNLGFDYIDGKYVSRRGIRTRVPYYGEVRGVKHLDKLGTANIWGNIIEQLEEFGYTNNATLRGHPYDWRVGPNGYEEEYTKLKALIEETSTMNGDVPVSLCSLSMGSPYLAKFFQTMDVSWKERYIHSWISVGGVFGGSLWPVSTLMTEQGLYVLSGDSFKRTLGSWGSMMWLMPSSEVFGNHTIVQTNKRNYTGSDIEDLLRDARFDRSLSIYKDVKEYQSFPAPGVDTVCIYGVGIPTQSKIEMKKGLRAPRTYTITEEEGDGTVLLPSLNYCEKWKDQQAKPVKIVQMDQLRHADGVKDPRVIHILMEKLGLFRDAEQNFYPEIQRPMQHHSTWSTMMSNFFP